MYTQKNLNLQTSSKGYRGQNIQLIKGRLSVVQLIQSYSLEQKQRGIVKNLIFSKMDERTIKKYLRKGHVKFCFTA